MTNTLDGRRAGRAAFTLIELLMVIAILAILVALLASAVIKALALGPQALVTSEISQLSTGINAFKQEFNVSYVPSRLLLCEDGNYAYYANNAGSPYQQLAIDSQNYLQMMFGSRFNLTTTAVKWRNDGTIIPYVTAGNPPMILEGQHCLVFLLGGIPAPTSPGVSGSSGVCQGFSTNPTNPTTSGGTRRGPFFDFKASRLYNDARNIGYGATGIPLNFFVYIDGFNKSTAGTAYANTYPMQPYAFFSSYRTSNNYNRYGSSDCPSLLGNVGNVTYQSGILPYQVPGTNTFLNPNSYQILSAGPDGIWGVPTMPLAVKATFAGGPWPGAIGQGTAGLDDIGNFSKAMLGAPQQ